MSDMTPRKVHICLTFNVSFLHHFVYLYVEYHGTTKMPPTIISLYSSQYHILHHYVTRLKKIVPQRASGIVARHLLYLETNFYQPPLAFEWLQEPEM